MATRGKAHTATFVAWDTSANAPKTGDASNITPRYCKDGTSAALTTATVTEVDATNFPGLYKVGLSSTETDADLGIVGGKSSTSNVVIIPTTLQFERLPDAAPGASGGVPRVSDLPAAAPSAATVADAVWDEALSGHTTSGSAGAALTSAASASGSTVQDSGTAQAGGSSTVTLKSSTSITLDTDSVITITGGTGVGQTGRVSAWNGTTKVATMVKAWNVAPDNTSTYEVLWVPLDKTGYALTSSERNSIAAAIGARTPTARNLTNVTAPTVDDCLLAAAAAAGGDASISSTTLTLTHLDGTTTAFTKTLNDATTPTSRT